METLSLDVVEEALHTHRAAYIAMFCPAVQCSPAYRAII
jgi:hypothetical protein